MKYCFSFLMASSAIVLFTACGGKDKKTAETTATTDTTVTAQPVVAAPDSTLGSAKSVVEKELSAWGKSFSNFNLDSFKLSHSSDFGVEEYGDVDLKKFYELYKSSLVFAPDSSQFIDLYSYGLTLEKVGKKIVAVSDVDNGVTLCDLKTKNWKRILFFGPSAWIEEAVWTSPTTFILAGVGPTEDMDENTAFLMLGDTNEKKFRSFYSKAPRLQSTKYEASGMKKLKIDEWE